MIDAERELALKEASTKELVSELRKRDGVEVVKAEIIEKFWAPEDSYHIINAQVHTFNTDDDVTAIILRITD